jgi:hypothetical protein
MTKRLLIAIALLASPFLWSSGASAQLTLSIGQCSPQPACAPVLIPGFLTNPATTPASASVTGFIVGIWNITASATGTPPLTPPAQLQTNTITASTSGPGSIIIAITEQGNTTPLGVNNYNSGFTVNSLSSTMNVTEMTLNSPANTLFATGNNNPGDLLSQHAFPGPITTATGFNANANSLSDGPGPFSLTTEYVITATGAGSANLTVTLASVAISTPEPASLTLLGSALIGLGWLGRRRRKTA